jgi:hypothetical protein
MARNARTLVAVALGTLVLLGCTREDPRLKRLTVGITRDSAIAALGVRSAEGREGYLVKGQFYDVMMLRREGTEGPLDSLSRKEYSPVVVINGQLAGWGWKYWDSISQDIRLPLKPK